MLQGIDVREERGQAAEDLHAYAKSLSGQLGYLAAQARSRNGWLTDDLKNGDRPCDDDGFREVVFSDLESREFWPIHRAVQ